MVSFNHNSGYVERYSKIDKETNESFSQCHRKIKDKYILSTFPKEKRRKNHVYTGES